MNNEHLENKIDISQNKDKQDILDTLKTKKIKPHSKLFFKTKEVALITTILTILVVVGAVLSTIIFLILDRDKDIYVYLNRSYYQDLLYGIPFFWIIIFILLIYILIVIQRKIRRGYRVETKKVFPIILIIVSLLAWGFFFGGLKNKIHTFLYYNVPAYRPLTDAKEELWDNPNYGLIFGIVENITQNEFVIKTDDEGTWLIHTSPDTVFGPNVIPIHKGEVVKINGNISSDYTFDADIVQEWSDFNQD